MKSRHVEIAKELVAYFNGLNLSEPFTAERGYLFDYQKRNLNNLFVGVSLGQMITIRAQGSRGGTPKDFEIVCYVVQNIPDQTQRVEFIDSRWTLIEEINSHIEANFGRGGLKLADSNWQSTEVQEREQENIDEKNQFVMVMKYVFRSYVDPIVD